MYGIDFLAKTLAQPMVDKLMVDAKKAEASIGCSCCGRLSDEWLYPGLYIHELSSYQVWEEKCLACQVLFVSMPEHFGEGRNGRLGMLKGVGCLISEKESIVYATGEHYKRMTAVTEPLFDNVVPLAGFNLFGDAWARMPDDAPFLLITNLGVKKSSLVENLKVTQSQEAVYACAESDRLTLAKDALILPSDLSETPRKAVNAWIEMLIRHAQQYLSREERRTLTELNAGHPQLAQATARLTADPHTRLQTLYITRKLLLEA